MLKRAYLFIQNFLFSLLFPCICIGCGVEGRWICDKCLKMIDVIKNPFCPECRRPTLNGEFCKKCSPNFALDGIFICTNFGDGVLKEAIHQFKYDRVFDIGGILGEIMAGKIKSQELRIINHKFRFDYVIPVPLHKRRLKERGFNQSEILAKKVCNTRSILVKNILTRKKYTIPQAELSREKRLTNLREVFIFDIKHGNYLQGKKILLVDDITTTGATLEECAKVLKQNGVKNVWGIVLAKGK